MNKLTFYIVMTLTLLLSLSLASAVEDEGIYQNDDVEITTGTFSYSDISYVRDDYYGVVYRDGSGNGVLQVIELDDNHNIVNTSVDTHVFDGNADHPKILNFNKNTGMSVVAYRQPGGGDNPHVFSFDLYPNGTVNPRDSEHVYNDEDVANIGLYRIGEEHFITGGVLNSYQYKMMLTTFKVENTTGVISPTYSGGKYCIENGDYGGYPQISMFKIGGSCYIFYKNKGNGRGYYVTKSCSNTLVSGGTDGSLSCYSSGAGTQFEANEIHHIDASYDSDAGFIYTVYGETLSSYPVLTVMNASDNSVISKQRINEDSVTSTNVITLDSNNLLYTYSTSSGLYFKKFYVDETGTATEVYSKKMNSNGSDSQATIVENAVDTYLASYTASGHVVSFGAGVLPPPGPEDTQLTITDERTLEPLNMTDLELTFYAYCTNETAYQTEITNTTESIPVSCDYEGFGIKVSYINYLNFTESYTRYYLRDLDDTYGQFYLDVYLINPHTTDYVTTNVFVDDLTSLYNNTKVYFEKNINGTTTQITAFDLDLENKMRAVLMTDEIYYAYLDSDVTSKEFLGKYVSATAGTVQDYKVFNLYDIQMKPNYIILDNKVDYQIYSEEYQVEYRARTAELMDDNLINVTFSLYNGTINGTLIYNESSGDSYDPDNLYNLFSGGPFNYSDYENETVTGKLHIYYSDNAQIRQIVYTVPLWVGSEKIKLPLMDYVDQSFMDWFLLILFSVIALFATMQTANMASMGIIGLAALFVIFGWFSVGIGTLALAAMISLISLLAKRSDDQ